MTEWHIFVFAGIGGGILLLLYSIDKNLEAILCVLRHQAGLDRND